MTLGEHVVGVWRTHRVLRDQEVARTDGGTEPAAVPAGSMEGVGIGATTVLLDGDLIVKEDRIEATREVALLATAGSMLAGALVMTFIG